MTEGLYNGDCLELMKEIKDTEYFNIASKRISQTQNMLFAY